MSSVGLVSQTLDIFCIFLVVLDNTSVFIQRFFLKKRFIINIITQVKADQVSMLLLVETYTFSFDHNFPSVLSLIFAQNINGTECPSDVVTHISLYKTFTFHSKEHRKVTGILFKNRMWISDIPKRKETLAWKSEQVRPGRNNTK